MNLNKLASVRNNRIEADKEVWSILTKCIHRSKY